MKYLIEWLQNDNSRKIRAAIIGPAGSGKRMLANHVSDRTGAIRIDKRDIVSDPYDEDIQVRQI